MAKIITCATVWVCVWVSVQMFVLWCVLMWMKFNVFFPDTLLYNYTRSQFEKLLWLRFTNAIYTGSSSRILSRSSLIAELFTTRSKRSFLQMKLRCVSVCLCVRSSSVLKITVENKVFNETTAHGASCLKHLKYVNKSDSWTVAVNLKSERNWKLFETSNSNGISIWNCGNVLRPCFSLLCHSLYHTRSKHSFIKWDGQCHVISFFWFFLKSNWEKRATPKKIAMSKWNDAKEYIDVCRTCHFFTTRQKKTRRNKLNENNTEQIYSTIQTKTEWKIHCIQCWANLFDLCFLSLGSHERFKVKLFLYPVASSFVFGFSDLPSLKLSLLASVLLYLEVGYLIVFVLTKRKKKTESENKSLFVGIVVSGVHVYIFRLP